MTWNRAALSVIRPDNTIEAGDKGRDKTPRSSMPLENTLKNLIPMFNVRLAFKLYFEKVRY